MPDPGTIATGIGVGITAATKGPELVDKIVKAWDKKAIGVTDLQEDLHRYEKLARKEAFKRYKQIFSDARLRTLALQGLLLREVVDRDPNAAQERRQFILKRWDVNGLWIAEAVQMGVIENMEHYLLQKGLLESERHRHVREFFQAIEQRSRYVQDGEKHEHLVQAVLSKLRNDQPMHFLVAGAGNASRVTARVLQDVRLQVHRYDVIPIPGNLRAAALFMFNPNATSAKPQSKISETPKRRRR